MMMRFLPVHWASMATTWFALEIAVWPQVPITNPLPGRAIVKMLPDYGHPKVYALNRGGAAGGTVLALNSTNGTILAEIAVGLNPTDMAVTPLGDALYVINAGSRTISQVDLDSFTVVAEKTIATPYTYNIDYPLYVAAGPSGRLFYTDGAWGPQIYFFDFNAGTNLLVLDTQRRYHGAAAMVLNRQGTALYFWRQLGWNTENGAWVTRGGVNADGSLTTFQSSLFSTRQNPPDTPIFLDAADRWVFNKQQMFLATNLAVLVNTFSNNIYAISTNGSLAFGPTEIFNTANGLILTNLPFASTVQTLSPDQGKLFRYQAATTNLVVFDLFALLPTGGPVLVPTPADGAVVILPLTNLTWTLSPVGTGYDVYFGTNQAQVAAATSDSPQFQGRRTTPQQPISLPLNPGMTYFWRVDMVSFSFTNTGPVWSFTVAPFWVSINTILASSVAHCTPDSITLELSGDAAWTAFVADSSWLTITPTNGRAPGNLSVAFQTASLAPGQYTNTITLQAGDFTVQIPVSLTVSPLNIVKMTADRKRPYIYAIQAPVLTGQEGRLLFINTQTGSFEKMLPIGVNPVDLSVNDAEGRLYIASWTEAQTYVVDLATQTLLPSLNLGTDVYKINAGRAGRVVTEGEDQTVYVTLFNSTNGAKVADGLVREGDGECDPSGRFYYHVDNNTSGAGIYKWNVEGDTFTLVASSNIRGSYYGSRNLVMSADGSRVFWTRVIFDSNLQSLDLLPSEIYSCSTNGQVAFTATEAYDTITRLRIHSLPVSSSVSVVDGANQYYWYFAQGALDRLPMSVVQAPKITQPPATNTAVQADTPVYLTVSAIGLAPLSYQWHLDGREVPGATNFFLSLPGLRADQEGAYQVVVFNAFGAVTSTVARVTLLVPPSIAASPLSTNVLAGQCFQLAVAASGFPLSYRWFLDTTSIGGATGAVLTVSNAQAINEGVYRVVITNSVGAVTSAPALVRVFPSAPQILTQPLSASAYASSNITFSVQAKGTQPFHYQWFFGRNFLANATAPTLTLAGVQDFNAGEYFVVVSNTLGCATSAVATLTVLPLAPYFTVQPSGTNVSAGGNYTLHGQASGSQPIVYYWQRNGTNLAGATSNSLQLTGLTVEDSGNYTLLASNIAGISTSMVAVLTVYQNATLLVSLSNHVAQKGDTVVLAVEAAGTQPLSYSWQLNGLSLPETNATLVLTNIQFSQAGFYSVRVANQFGQVTSVGRVSVLERPSSLVTWGDNVAGQCNAPAGLRDLVAVAGGDFHSIALRRNGTLLGWGYNGDGQAVVPTNTQPFIAIAAGSSHNLALTKSGSVVAWGHNHAGQTNVPAATVNKVLAIAAGDAHSLALLYTGTVVAWGDNSLGQTSVPKGLAGVRAIAAGRKHNLALRTDGTVVGWGYGALNQTVPPASLTNVIAIAAGYLHSVALCSNGTVVCWGDNTYGQTNVPPELTNVVSIAAGDFHTFAQRGDGRIVGWGNGWYGQLAIPDGLTDAVAVASGYYHGLALVPSPQLRLVRQAGELVLQWEGAAVLQWAPAVTGPFEDLPSPSGSYSHRDFTAPARFFRLRR